MPFNVTINIVPTSAPIAAHKLAFSNNIKIITAALADILNVMFWIIVFFTRLPICRRKNNFSKLESIRVMSLVSIDNEAPVVKKEDMPL